MEREPKTLTEIVNEIISIIKTGGTDILPQAISRFNQNLETAGRAEQKKALELVKNNREILGDPLSNKMEEGIDELLDLYGKLS